MSALTSPLQATTTITPARSQASTASQSSDSSDTSSTSQFNSINGKNFLTLLTTQLRHQDPTNPMDQQDLASQMAQFSTATGIDNLNNKFESLTATQGASELARASGLIGHKVTTDGNALLADNSGKGEGAYKLATSAESVTVEVRNASGEKVDTVDLGSAGAGTHTFEWDGGEDNRIYQFKVSATNEAGESVAASTQSLFSVNGVSQNASGVQLALTGNPNPLSLEDVQNVL